MAYDYDVCVIGLGPAGMAASSTASEMGLRVLAIEKRSLGGASLHGGSIPRRELLRMGHARQAALRFSNLAPSETPSPAPAEPLRRIAEHIELFDEKKMQSMLGAVDLRLREGPASFVDPHTVEVGGKRYTAKRIVLCVGSRPAMPPIPGLSGADALTDEAVFSLDRLPASLVVIGGGAIGCEIAQAFHHLGARVSIVHTDEHLLPHSDWETGRFLEAAFAKEGIEVQNGRRISEVATSAGGVAVRTNVGETLRGERVLVAAGRSFDFSDLRLGNAGVEVSERGIRVDATLRTTARHIYAAGDANGAQFLECAAMHQGMVAVVNSLVPPPFRRNFHSYVAPRTVHTEPQIAHVGWLERDLKAHDMAYEAYESKFEDYGAGMLAGSVRVYASSSGRIYGARIIGEGAVEMINEWGLAIQNRLRLHRLLFLQHSFPSMSFLSRRTAESWAASRMKDPLVRRIIKALT